MLTTDTDHGETEPYPEVPKDTWVRQENLGVWVFYISQKSNRFKTIEVQTLQVRPDTVYLNLFFSPAFVLFPLWLKLQGKLPSRVVLCPRGTLYDSAVSLKWYKKKPFLRLIRWMGIHRVIQFHATNEREATAIGHYFPGAQITIADNWPQNLQAPFQVIPKTSGELTMIFVARIVPLKNLLFVLEILQDIQRQLDLTIVGPREDDGYWQMCEQQIARLPKNIRVNNCGPKSPGEVSELLRANHVFILPTKGENFGHAIFEALLAGRPVLISDQTPWQNLEQLNAGWTLPLNTPAAFTRVIGELAEAGQVEYDRYAAAAWAYAATFINKPRLIAQYKALFS